MGKKKVLKGDIKEISKITSDIKELILLDTESLNNEILLTRLNNLQESIEENKKISKGSNITIIVLTLLIPLLFYFAIDSQRTTKNVLKTASIQDSLLIEMSKLLDSSDSSHSTTMNQYGRLVGEYGNVVDDYVKQRDDYYNQLNSIELYKDKLHLIDSIYNIRFRKVNKTDYLEGTKVDSALRLLPYYRNKLNYDKNKKRWVITIEN